MTSASLDFERAGTRLTAYAERALFWPRGRCLLLADLHLGKGEVLRRAGIPVPRGGTAHDLARLSALIEHCRPAQLWVLGDLLHGPVPPQSDWLLQWLEWRERHGEVAVHVVRGNHDRALDDRQLAIESHTEGHLLEPFVLTHHATETLQGHVLCGHLHPVCRLPALRQRWPAFHLAPGQTVLPAFSAFTGGSAFQPAAGEQALLCVQGHVVRVVG
ncbi:putative phosphoesterase [Comamonas sp. BIGb0124]|uniref:ligase-associated DNA damage response endonuclease PdeM n=1 Tax=Comamonas sp. BIGb0124 TaxID=2485130 RepID=UPI000F4A4E2D|nr:ligase-associated DNA damage response endonuclease PdeM [Comamonas sp. BIGb0124]ROR25124.1 putative phosphoesterase [Comamonas sp. BIGb0124]